MNGKKYILSNTKSQKREKQYNSSLTKRHWSLVLLFLIYGSLSAQNPAEEFAFFEKKYPNSAGIDVALKQRLDIKIVKGKLEIYYDFYSETLILTDMASGFANEKIHFSPQGPLVSVEAWSLIPDGNKYKKIPVKNFSYMSAVDDLFFDDSRVCDFVYTGLTKGSKVVYKYRKKINDPYLLPRFLFSSVRGVDASEAVIEYDNLVDVQFNYFGFKPGEGNNYSVNKDKKKTTVQINMQSVPKIKPEKYVSSYLPYFIHLVPHIAYYKTSSTGNPVAVLPDLEHLFKYNVRNIDSIAKRDDAQLAVLADSITAPYSTELDKVKAIYYWVQHNIHYVAIEDGNNGVVPTNALNVYEKRYGDCKGMANLIYVLLKKLGINAYHTWVGTVDLPYKYTEIHTPFVDNHMIVTYIDQAGNYRFLDATAEFQSIESAPESIQGKECMIAISKDSFQIKEIPYSTSKVIYNNQIGIENLDLKINETEQLYGNIARNTAYYVARRTEEKKRQLFISLLKEEGFAKSTLKKIEYGNLYEVDKPLETQSEYVLNDYIIKSNAKLYVKPVLRGLNPVIIESDREYEFEFEQKEHCKWIQEIQIPTKYITEILPKEVSYNHPLFSFSSKIATKGDKIYVEVELLTDFVRLPKSDYKSWNEMNRMILDFCNQSFVFKQK